MAFTRFMIHDSVLGVCVRVNRVKGKRRMRDGDGDWRERECRRGAFLSMTELNNDSIYD